MFAKFGKDLVSKDLIEAVKTVMHEGEQKEELKGGQVKLDKNRNGKLDSQDFKMLRGEKKVDEAESEYQASAKYRGKVADFRPKSTDVGQGRKITGKLGKYGKQPDDDNMVEPPKDHTVGAVKTDPSTVVPGYKSTPAKLHLATLPKDAEGKPIYKGARKVNAADLVAKRKAMMAADEKAKKDQKKEAYESIEEGMEDTLHPAGAALLKHIKPQHHNLYKPHLTKDVFNGSYGDRTSVLKAAKDAGHLKMDLKKQNEEVENIEEGKMDKMTLSGLWHKHAQHSYAADQGYGHGEGSMKNNEHAATAIENHVRKHYGNKVADDMVSHSEHHVSWAEYAGPESSQHHEKEAEKLRKKHGIHGDFGDLYGESVEHIEEGGEKYKVKSTGHDTKGSYYISPSTNKKVYKSGVEKGDHEVPGTGEIKKKMAPPKQEMKEAKKQPLSAYERLKKNMKKKGYDLDAREKFWTDKLKQMDAQKKESVEFPFAKSLIEKTEKEMKEKKDMVMSEDTMTDAQKSRREKYVMSMKDKTPQFKEKYGKRWKEVMYATATKMAMKEEETIDEKLDRNVRTIDTLRGSEAGGKDNGHSSYKVKLEDEKNKATLNKTKEIAKNAFKRVRNETMMGKISN